ncbi:hypothetical protein GQ44DRAFT_769755 [Phaeosphaeriaceae sp. PMI808]|nr:hypothetical protein GQ44DRAFT_769755 [Phaeosphaeriaceae sp. PMI808]
MPVHETVTYPKVDVSEDNNSCLNPSMSREHVLDCGHLVNTVLPWEPCAPNCHHISMKSRPSSLPEKNKRATEKENEREVTALPFYCDACVETEFEHRISTWSTSSAADSQRAEMASAAAKTNGKGDKSRKCYIALKITSIPVYSGGYLPWGYITNKEHHPFDVSRPRSGANMFEDLDQEEATLRAYEKSQLDKCGEGKGHAIAVRFDRGTCRSLSGVSPRVTTMSTRRLTRSVAASQGQSSQPQNITISSKYAGRRKSL